MAYYLHQVAFTSDAWAKMAKQPQNREAAMRPVIEKLGGKLVFYAFCFGEYDSILITQFPDSTSAAAGPIAASAAGTVRAVKTTPLITVEEAMEAMRKAGGAGFQPPK
jgi:uncharacterized protein with GYD domain